MHTPFGDRRAKLMALLVALPLGLLVGASIADGSMAPVAVLLVGCLLLLALVRVVAEPADARWLRAVVIGAFLFRCGVGAALFWRSLALGSGGFLTGDDQMYASAAWHLVRYLRGDPEMPYVPPDWGGEYYLHATYVYIETALFSVFGRHVLTMIVVNAACAGMTILLAADVARRLFGRGASIATACVLALYPSLMLWSALNLRDTMVVTFIVLAIWAVHRYPGRSAAAWIAVALLGAWAQDGLRRYVLVELAVVIPAAVAVAPAAMSLARRSAATAGAVTLSAALLLYTGAIGLITVVPTEMLSSLENIRNTMSVGRLAFTPTAPPAVAIAPPTPIPTVVPTATRSAAPRTPSRAPAPATRAPGATPAPASATRAPGATPRPAPATRAPGATPAPAPATRAPGATPTPAPATRAPGATPAPGAATPAPTATPGIIDSFLGAVGAFFNPGAAPPLPPDDPGGDLALEEPTDEELDEGMAEEPEEPVAAPLPSPIAPLVVPASAAPVDPDKVVVTATLAYLPRGVVYALFAPFPWEVRTWVDVMLALETLLWYVVLAAAASMIVRERRRWRSFVPEVLFVGGTLLVLALTEGNAGTLVRHRAMIIPLVVVLASPGLAAIAQGALRRLSRRVALP